MQRIFNAHLSSFPASPHRGLDAQTEVNLRWKRPNQLTQINYVRYRTFILRLEGMWPIFYASLSDSPANDRQDEFRARPRIFFDCCRSQTRHAIHAASPSRAKSSQVSATGH